MSLSDVPHELRRVTAAATRSDLHVVLVHPEIPQNTGSIARLCAATRTVLHLIRPLGFSLEDRYLKRAGLDYWPYVELRIHEDWQCFLDAEQPVTSIYLSARVQRSYVHAPQLSEAPLHLVFGCETKGLPAEIVARNTERLFNIPIFEPAVRSLNLSNAVSIVVYDALRRRDRLD